MLCAGGQLGGHKQVASRGLSLCVALGFLPFHWDRRSPLIVGSNPSHRLLGAAHPLMRRPCVACPLPI